MSKGWIKLHRSITDHPRFQDQKWLIVWIRCLTLATHKPHSALFAGRVIELQKGQFITSRKSLSEKTGVSESTVERILKTLETEQQIEQRSSSVSRLITITNWIEYQDGEQEDGQPMDSGRTADGQRADTNKNEKKEKEGKEVKKARAPFTPPTVEMVAAYCQERGNSINPSAFIDKYVGNGWMVGRGKMVDWKAVVRTWEHNNFGGQKNGVTGKHPQQFKSAQEKREDSYRAAIATLKRPGGRDPGPDYQDVHVVPEGRAITGNPGL